MDALIRTMDENLAKFVQVYGATRLARLPSGAGPPSRKSTERTLSCQMNYGAAATRTAFSSDKRASPLFMDFITSFYPTAAVSCRIYFAAQQAHPATGYAADVAATIPAQDGGPAEPAVAAYRARGPIKDEGLSLASTGRTTPNALNPTTMETVQLGNGAVFVPGWLLGAHASPEHGNQQDHRR